MKNCRFLVAVLFVLGCMSSAHGQGSAGRFQSYWSVGPFLGAASYNGDLTSSTTKAVQPTFPGSALLSVSGSHLAFGVNIEHKFNPLLSFRGTLTYGFLSASDGKAAELALKNRNLGFNTNIYEASGQLVVDFISNKGGIKFRPRVTPFIFGGIGVFNFDPYSYRDGSNVKVFLQPLNTEKLAKPYKTIALSIPFGGGLKFKLTDRLDLRAEVGIRYTTTDYIDDVGGNTPFKETIAAHNGTPPTNGDYPYFAPSDNSNQAYFSDRRLTAKGISPDTRGTSKGKDWYAFSGISLMYILKEGGDYCPPSPKYGRYHGGGSHHSAHGYKKHKFLFF